METLVSLGRWLTRQRRPDAATAASPENLPPVPGRLLMLTATDPLGNVRSCALPLARLGPDGVVIGRGGGAELILDDPTISRRHARLWLADGSLMVEDLGSRNGTQLAGLPPCRPGEPVALEERPFRLGALSVVVHVR